MSKLILGLGLPINRGNSTAPGGGGGTMPGGDITHGDQLTLSKVGPWAVQGVSQGSETLRTISGASSERVSNWHPRPSWIPGTTFDPLDLSNTNYGGIVGVDGVTLDGRTYAAGTYIVQNTNFSGNNSIIIEGKAGTSGPFVGVVFRACRMRGYYLAPGFFGQNSQVVDGTIAFHYCDAGGLDLVTPCESTYESSGLSSLDHMLVLRCYVSRVTSGIFLRNNGDSLVETYMREVTDFGNPAYHLNGCANSGGQTATLWLRNNMVLVKQTGSTQLTDVIQFAADTGGYAGGGTNFFDGSSGYQVKDNYLGGANYTLQFGVDGGRGTTMANCNVSGNKITTSLYTKGGESGLGYKGPATWGTSGNVWAASNIWADGANSGVSISSSEITPG
jgi:hypothetical protein